MSHHESRSFSGTITHIFGHRFVVRTEDSDILADLTPGGIEQITLRLHDVVRVEGEMKPSELKVTRLTRGGQTIQIDHPKKPHHDAHADLLLMAQLAAAKSGRIRDRGFATPQTDAISNCLARKGWRNQ